MSETVLTDLLPAHETVVDIRAAMVRLDRRRDEAIARRDTAEQDRLEALRTPSMALRVVKHAETARHDALIDLDRIALLRNDLSLRLKAAVERELVEAQEAEIAARRNEYEAARDAFQDRLRDYEAAASAIVGVLVLERAQQRAGERLRSAVLAALPIGAWLPGDPLAGIEGPRLGLADQVVLPPARPRTAYFWRQESPSVHPDAIRYRAEAAIRGR